MTLTVAIPQILIAPGSQLTIPNVSWQDYTHLMDELGSKRNTRLAYYRGLLEIMSPSVLHERPNRLISDILKTILECQERDWEDFGSTTLKQPEIAGIEPDTCFYIQNADRMRDCQTLDLSHYPPPDLAVECDLTSKTVIDAYQAIQVPEVWIYANEQLKIYLYSDQGYQASQQSRTFPDLPLTTMIPLLIQTAHQIGTRKMLAELESQF